MTRKYQVCKTCSDWGWSDEHECPPVFECIMEDGGDWEFLYRIHGRNAETAAEKFVEFYEQDGDGPRIAYNESEVIVLVRREGSEEITRWEVRGWLSPCYSAEPADDPEPEAEPDAVTSTSSQDQPK